MGVGVADRNRERIGGVVGAGRLFEAEQPDDHRLNLLLVRAAVARDRLLYLHRRVLEPGQLALGGGELNHADRPTDGEPVRDIFIEKQLLHRHGVGCVLVQERVHIVVDRKQPLAHRRLGAREQHPDVDWVQLSPLRANHAKARRCRSRIESQYNHRAIVPLNAEEIAQQCHTPGMKLVAFIFLTAMALIGCGHPSRAIGSWKGTVGAMSGTLYLEPNLNGKLIYDPVPFPGAPDSTKPLQPAGMLFGWHNINDVEIGINTSGNISGADSMRGKLSADGRTLTLTEAGQEFSLTKQ